ncbi:hypothetical protein GCM10010174_42930 [Kutzneria viridogrisea]|uniref:MOSC domain-containing protein n=2 Tax=Kutzneria TaxID=43356 RepID=W5W6H4_9PSEU|nr:MOSC N-terminal beta barrel domain-containing protein [Kutzneria albida]AHH96096.1 hypothetical protein KALB_2728 [Kutzneria albida DSM 43870]MBA8928698.1 hypothetical protein [Kutzneria viridogrisea]
MRIGWVEQLRRYPVKSMAGELLSTVDFDARGVRQDRLWALRLPDGRLGSGKTSARFRRVPGIALASARCVGEVPVITLADGTEHRGDTPEIDSVLSAAFGTPLGLRRECGSSHFDDGPVHLVSSAAIEHVERLSGVAVAAERLRPTVLVRGRPGAEPGYRHWLGRRVRIGPEVELEVLAPMRRCGMVNNATRGLPRDNRVLRAIAQHADLVLGVVAAVVRGGRASTGDEVRLTGNGS